MAGNVCIIYIMRLYVQILSAGSTMYPGRHISVRVERGMAIHGNTSITGWALRILLLVIMLAAAADLHAAGIYQNQNQSAEFIRTINRNASTDTDAVYFNPGATAFFKQGWHLYISNQYITDQRQVKTSSPIITHFVGDVSDQSYKGKASTFLYPDIHVAYKREKMAFFSSFYIIGAGASANFDNGLPMFDTLALSYLAAQSGGFKNIMSYQADIDMQGLSYFLGACLGASYEVNDMVGVALGTRFIRAVDSTKVSLKWVSAGNTLVSDLLTDPTTSQDYTDMRIDAEGSGNSYSIIGGVHVKPMKGMEIGVKCEYHTIMKVTNKTNALDVPDALLEMEEVKDNLTRFEDGAVSYKTLPPMATIGISYIPLRDLKVDAGLTYFFNRWAYWGNDLNGNKINKKFKNGYDVGMSIEYAFMPRLKASSGFTYSISGRTPESTSDGEIGLDCVTVGTGFSYALAEDLDITLAGMRVFFKNQINPVDLSQVDDEEQREYLRGKTELSESTWIVAVGVTYRIGPGKSESSTKNPADNPSDMSLKL
jgi:long-chain fatty acid transport protein